MGGLHPLVYPGPSTAVSTRAMAQKIFFDQVPDPLLSRPRTSVRGSNTVWSPGMGRVLRLVVTNTVSVVSAHLPQQRWR